MGMEKPFVKTYSKGLRPGKVKTINLSDMFHGDLRVLCPDDFKKILEDIGVVYNVYEYSCGRQYTALFVIGDGKVVEVTCSGYSDKDNYIRFIHGFTDDEIMEYLKNIVKNIWMEMVEFIEGEISDLDEKLKLLERARSIEELEESIRPPHSPY